MIPIATLLLQDSTPSTEGSVPVQGGQEGAGTTPKGPPPGGLFGASLMPLVLVVAIFWVLVILPQGKERKKRAKMLDELSKGDKVMTTGGLYGQVSRVDGDDVTLTVADGVRLRFHKQAIQTVVDGSGATEAPREGQQPA